MEFNEGERRSAPPAGRDLIHEVHGSRAVAGGGDVGTERPSINKGPRLDIPAISREANGAVVSIVALR